MSAIVIDQAYEQINACVKGDGGAVGLTENPAALCRWMVSCPEMARAVIAGFEGSVQKKQDMACYHHEQNKHAQTAFAQGVKSLSATIEEMGNPFSESSSDLVLDSGTITDSTVADTVFQIEKLNWSRPA